jgi:hypothetical protein
MEGIIAFVTPTIPHASLLNTELLHNIPCLAFYAVFALATSLAVQCRLFLRYYTETNLLMI